jgi:hypothetical protein
MRRYLRERQAQNRPVQWYEEPGLQTGAFSSFLGLTLLDAQTESAGAWEAIALGDSCLFQVRDDQLIASFPLAQSSDFNSRPWLIPSKPNRNVNLLQALQTARGQWTAHDQFYLMTDALAAWFLRELESGASGCTPWQLLPNLDNLEVWINTLRTEGLLRNDDVTWMHISVVSRQSSDHYFV